MENIYLIGFMGTGKSTVSQCLCKNYDYIQLEMDEEIAKKEGMSISHIFEEKGEEYFRSLETGLLKHLGEKTGLVVSCGGGTATRECNVQEMKKHGRVVLLCAAPETILDRVKNTHDRPLLEGNMNVDYIRSLMEKRRPMYEAAADFTVRTDGKSAEMICQEIMNVMA